MGAPTGARHADQEDHVTTTATETGQQPPAATPPAGAPAAAAAPPAGDPPAGQQPPAAAPPAADPPAGQQAAGDGDLTPEEEAALGDPGKRAIERYKEREATVRTELETTRGQLQTALQQIAAGGDQAQQQALQTVTGERDEAQQTLARVTAAMRNGLAVPHPGEAPEAWAARVTQVAGLLQGADDAALDNSARVLLSLTATPGAPAATPPPARVPAANPGAATPGSGEAGTPNMNDAIRAMAGRTVQR